MFDKIKRMDVWDRKLLFSVFDGICNAFVLFFLCAFAMSSLWAEEIWINVFLIVIAAAVSSFGYWNTADDLTAKRKPLYCLLLSLLCAFWIAWLLKDMTYQQTILFFMFNGFFVQFPSVQSLITPDAAQEMLLTFVIGIYSAVAVMLRILMCIALELRNARMKEAPIAQNRYRIPKTAVLLPFVLICVACFAAIYTFVNRTQLEIGAWTVIDALPNRGHTHHDGDAEWLLLMIFPIVLALDPVLENLNKYVELFDTYVRFNSFRFRLLKPVQSVHVKYEDIYAIRAKFIGKRVLYMELSCHNFKHKIKLPASIAKHKELFARLYKEVVRVNPDVVIGNELHSLLTTWQNKE